MNTKPTDVAIIGAGLAGTLLALSLHEHLPLPASKITIFESRSPDAPEIGSGVVLTPNGLHVLDKLGVYDRIKNICWTNGYRTYVNDRDEVTRRILVASEALYGFKNHRLYRRVLLRVVKDMLAERGVEIKYNQRFEGITSDDDKVTFVINGTPQTTSLLIGADGIYSSVRKHISPATEPEYTGVIGCLAHITWSSISWPTPDFERQCTIHGQPGAFFMIPETRDGSDVMVGLQVRHADMTRTEWETLQRDRDAMGGFWRRRYDDWHGTGQKVIDAVTSPPANATMFLWPFMRMPKLETWFSPRGTVVLVGDAAHAVPPSSGQGVSQALEDVWSLTLLLRQDTRPKIEAWRFWQDLRQRRIDAVSDWATNANNVVRLGEEERRRLVVQGKVPDFDTGAEFFDDMAWLYGGRSEREIEDWIGKGVEVNGKIG